MLSDPISTFIDELLFEQQSLTVVHRFAQRHARGTLPLQARSYRDLIPLSPPGTGSGQYAFDVDLDQCSGCKACVTACHRLNGLDPDEAWRTVGQIHGDDPVRPFQQTVTSACHHCLDPACLEGCPVLAYEKDPMTGIVRHLDDQCIGCQYCIWQCPYEVPQYSKRLGIVRKCDLCSTRLAAGEAPACVQSCPNEAIRITLLSPAQIESNIADQPALVPSAPPSSLTRPSTRYRSARRASGDHDRTPQPVPSQGARPELPHWPLVFMLVLSQAAIGMEVAAFMLRLLAPGSAASINPVLVPAALGSLLVGLGIGAAHLGQPLRAWRAFLGARTSWLSREFIAFGLLVPALLLAAVCEIAEPTSTLSLAGVAQAGYPVSVVAHGLASGTALLALVSSIMIYHATRRPTWRLALVAPQFAGTALLLGCAALWLIGSLPEIVLGALESPMRHLSLWAPLGVLVTTLIQFPGMARPENPAPEVRLRRALALAGGVFLPAVFLPARMTFAQDPASIVWMPLAGCGLLLAAELAGRVMFFTRVRFPRMPRATP